MSNVANTRSPGAFLTSLKALQEGLQTYVPPTVTQFAAGGRTSSIADILAELKGYMVAYQAAEDAAVVHSTAVQAREVVAPTALARYGELRIAIKSTFGSTNAELTRFGMEPDQVRAPMTLASKQARAAKAKATRVARGTRGKRQRAAIHGIVPAAAPVEGAAKQGG